MSEQSPTEPESDEKGQLPVTCCDQNGRGMGKTVLRCPAVPWRLNQRSCFRLHKQQSYKRYHAKSHLLFIRTNFFTDRSFKLLDQIKDLQCVYGQNSCCCFWYFFSRIIERTMTGFISLLFSFLRSLRGSELPHRSSMGLQRRHSLDVYCGRLICLYQRSGVGGHCQVQETASSSELDLGQSCHCWSWRDSFCQHY